MEALEADALLLREENARLRVKLEASPDMGNVIERLRALPAPSPQVSEEPDPADDAWQMLTEVIVMRNSLIDICREIGRVMTHLETSLESISPPDGIVGGESGSKWKPAGWIPQKRTPQGGTTVVKKVTALAALAVAIFVIAVSSASAALPNQRTDLKVLLLSANGAEPTTGAWEAALKREGVPYEKKIATADEPYTADTFANTLADGTPHAKYQAVIIASGGLVYADEAGNWGSALSSEEWAALADFESRYGIRQITAFTWPSAEYGLNSPTVSGDLTGVVGNLTTAGTTVFAVPQGPGADRQVHVRLPGDPRDRRELQDAGVRAERLGPARDQHAARRPRGDGVDGRRQRRTRSTTSSCGTGCSPGSRAAPTSAPSATT